MGGILGSLGIDPFYLFVILFVLQVAIIVLLCLFMINIICITEQL